MRRPTTGHLWGASAIGRGVRLNNPYRLATPWGDTAESLSATATYLDLSLAGVVGKPGGPSHGFVAHLSIALEGISQQTLTPGYVQSWRFSPRWIVLGRIGVPVVTRPDVNAGAEAALGALWFGTAGTGVTGELVGSLFYGAATRERARTAIPVIGVQVGVFLDYELIP